VIDTVGISRPAVCHDRLVRHAVHREAARGGTLSAAGLRRREGWVGPRRKRELASRRRRGAINRNYRGKHLQIHVTIERIQASSRRPGRRPSRMGAAPPTGRKLSALKTGLNSAATPTSRLRTSRILTHTTKGLERSRCQSNQRASLVRAACA
jgi:hypothetical protein